MTGTVFVQGGSATDHWRTLVSANPYPSITAEALCDGRKIMEISDLDGPGFYQGSILIRVAGEKVLLTSSYNKIPIPRGQTPERAVEKAGTLMGAMVRDLAIFLEGQINSVGDDPVVVSWDGESEKWSWSLLRPVSN